jgi:hypothetical protein
MKKLNLLLIVALLAVSLVAANPPGKLVTLQVINASGDVVYMKLEGRGTGAFYYLAIPRGATKYFTVLVDSYRRTTWACGGIMTTGSLVMTGQVKLKFVQCGKLPLRYVWNDLSGDGIIDENLDWEYDEAWLAPNFGEPTQEKVVAWMGYTNNVWVKRCHGFAPAPCTWFWIRWSDFTIQTASLWIKVKVGLAWRALRLPRGVYMRYRY